MPFIFPHKQEEDEEKQKQHTPSTGTKPSLSLAPKAPSIVGTTTQINTGETTQMGGTVPPLSTIGPELPKGGLEKTPIQRLQEVGLSDYIQADKWYKGDKPTRSELYARVFEIGKTEPERAEELKGWIDSAIDLPDSPFYQPYSQATNKAVEELQALGIDLSGGVTKDWLDENAWVVQYCETNADGTPKAPTKRSSPQQKIGYWMYKLLGDEEITEKAEAEWEAFKENVSYLAARDDMNLSDEQILDKIDWTLYPTLAGMQESWDTTRVPISLNRGVGYNQDAVSGVIWAARNGVEYEPDVSSVYAAMGLGVQWQPKDTDSRLDPRSPSYRPYSIATAEDEALYFGVKEFSYDWCEQNRWRRDSTDETERKMFDNVYDMEQTTRKAEEELQKLKAALNKRAVQGADSARILKDVMLSLEKEYPTLYKMNETMYGGDKLLTTRAIDFNWDDISKDFTEKCWKANNLVTPTDFMRYSGRIIGSRFAPADPTAKALRDARSKNIAAGAEIVDDIGTPDEQTVFEYGADPDQTGVVTQLADDIDSGNLDGQAAVDAAWDSANQQAAQDYLGVYPIVDKYETNQSNIETWKKEMEELQKEDEAEKPATSGSSIVPEGALVVGDAGASDVAPLTRGKETVTWETDELDMLANAGITDPFSSDLSTDQQRAVEIMLSGKGYTDTEIAEMFVQSRKETQEENGLESVLLFTADKLRLLEAQGISDPYDPDMTEAERAIVTALLSDDQLDAYNKKVRDRKISALNAKISAAEAENEAMQEQYATAKETIDEIDGKYDTALALEESLGITSDDTRDLRNAQKLYYQLGKDYVPTQYPTSSMYDASLEAGVDLPTVTATALMAKSNYTQQIAQAQQMLKTLKDAGYNTDDEYYQNVQRRIAAAEKQIEYADYFLYSTASDFDEVVQKQKDAAITAWNTPQSFWEGFTGIFSREKTRTTADGQVIPEAAYLASLDPSDLLENEEWAQSWAAIMNDREKDTYLYLLSKDKEAGPDSHMAQDYFDFMTNQTDGMLNNRVAYTVQEGMKEFGVDNPVAATLFSIASAPLGALSGLYALASVIPGIDYNPNHMLNQANTSVGAIRTGVKQDITDHFGKGTTMSNVANFMYDALMSAADSTVNGLLFGHLGASDDTIKALAKAGKGGASLALKVGSTVLSSSMMGFNAAGSAVQQAVLEGHDMHDALIMGAVTLACETLTEAITLGNIKESFRLGEGAKLKDLILNYGSKYLDDPLGEGVAQLIESYAGDIVFDLQEDKVTQIMADYNIKSREVAESIYWQNLWKEVGEAVLMGAAVSGISTAAGYVGGRISNIGNTRITPTQPVDGVVQKPSEQGQGTTDTGTSNEQQQTAPNGKRKVPTRPVDGVVQKPGEQGQGTTDTNTDGEEYKGKHTIKGKHVGENALVESGEDYVGPHEPKPPVPVNDQTKVASKLTILTTAAGADKSVQSASIGSMFMLSGDRSLYSTAAASAAGQGMVKKYGKKAVSSMSKAIQAANQMNIPVEQVTNAMSFGVMAEGSQTAAALDLVMKKGPTPENLNALLAAQAADMQNPEIIIGVQQKVRNNLVADRVKTLTGDGALKNQTQAAQEKVDKAKQNESTAREELNGANKVAQELQKDMVAAQEAWRADPGNDTLKGVAAAAVDKVQGALQVAHQFELSLINATNAVNDAQNSLNNQKSDAMNSVRAQAEADVDAALAAEAEQIIAAQQQAAADAAAAVQAEAEAQQAQEEATRQQIITDQQNGKLAEDTIRAKAEAIAEKKGYTGEEKAKVVERMVERATKKELGEIDMSKQLTDAEAKRIMGTLSRRFGVNIVIGEMPAGKNGSYDRSTNTITLSNKNTSGQVLTEFAMHEITHAIEQTKGYGKYKATVLGIMFSSQAEYNEAIGNKIAEYAEQGENLTPEQAEREIVADFARLHLNEKDTINRLVEAGHGGMLREILHKINNFFRGTTDKMSPEQKAEFAKLRRAERALTTSLRQRAAAAAKAGVHGDVITQGAAEAGQATQLQGNVNTEQAEGATVGEQTPVEYSAGTADLTDAQIDQMANEASTDFADAVEQGDTEGALQDIEFSATVPVSEFTDTKLPIQIRSDGMIAAHNMSMDRFAKALKLGAMAMPSVAVMPSGQSWNQFGDITIFFKSKVVDPKADPKTNKLYSGDAWTPMFPRGSKDYTNINDAMDYLTQMEEREFDRDKDGSSEPIDSTTWFKDYRQVFNLDAARELLNKAKGMTDEQFQTIADELDTKRDTMLESLRNFVTAGNLFRRGTSKETYDQYEYGRFLEKAIFRASEMLDWSSLDNPEVAADEVFARDMYESTMRETLEQDLGDTQDFVRKFQKHPEVLDSVIDYVRFAKEHLGSKFLEAKPWRAVSFSQDDVAAVMLPANLSPAVRDEFFKVSQLSEDVVFTPKDDAERAELFKTIPTTVEGVQFSAGNRDMTDAQIDQALAEMDNEYMVAVESGDTQTQQDLVDRAAKEAGYTERVYHGTPTGGFTVFDTDRLSYGRALGDGIYFTSVPEVANEFTRANGRTNMDEYSPKVYDGYLNLGDNPLVIDLDQMREQYGKKKSNLIDYLMKDEIKKKGADASSIIIKGIQDGSDIKSTVYVAKNSSQFKSADPVTYDDNGKPISLSERFNPKNPDIRYSAGNRDMTDAQIDQMFDEMVDNMTLDEFEEYFGDVMGTQNKPKQTESFAEELSDYGEDVSEEEAKTIYNEAVKDIVKEYDPTIYNGKLFVKPDTLEHWLSGSGFANSSQNYTKAYLTTMNPADFLRMTTTLPGGQQRLLDEAGTLNEGTKDFAENAKGQPIQLEINVDDKKVIGHEGRHRSIALARAGVTEIPVVLVDSREGAKYNKQFIPELTLEGQNLNEQTINGNTLTFKDVIPLNNANRDTLFQRFTATDQQRQEAAANQQNILEYSAGNAELTDAEIDQLLVEAGVFTKKQVAESTGHAGNSRYGQRQFGARTVQGSNMNQRVQNYLADHSDYRKETNQEQVDRAIAWVQSNAKGPTSDGFQEALDLVSSDNFDYRSADGQARMLTVMAMAAVRDDVNAQLRLAAAYNAQGTALGRMLQARKIFQMMTPLGRSNMLQNMEQKFNEELGREGSHTTVKLPQWLLDAAEVAQSPEEFKRVQKQAREVLADQIPANWKERLQGWRMFAMLANVRTHARNFIGNGVFIPAVGIKNKIGAVLESHYMKTGLIDERTKTLRATLPQDIKDFATADAKTLQDELTGESKYDEATKLKMQRKLFGPGLQKLYDFNSNMLEKEDWYFLKGHYRRALGSWMVSNGYTVEQVRNNKELLERGRTYAIEEAQKATYRDANDLAKTLSSLVKKGGPVGFFVDAVLPFKKTPANILKRGIEYSPVGLIKTLTRGKKHVQDYLDYHDHKLAALPKGALSPTQYINNLAAGLTGTAIAALGAALAKMGAITVGFDDDDKFEEMKGNQEFAVKLFGTDITYTLDWAAPACMPFFVGAALVNQAEDGFESLTIEEVMNAVANIGEPVFNLSMLDGVNNLFETSQYAETNTLTQVAANVLTNYASSYVPSAIGAVNRTLFDPVRRKSFVESGKRTGVGGTVRYAWEKFENKIPGLSQTNIPRRDAFGRTEQDPLVERALENFISPGYKTNIKHDPVLEESERLYNELGDGHDHLIPKLPGGTVSTPLDPNGNKSITLTAEQYDKLTQVRGETFYQVMSDLMENPYYGIATDEDKASMINDVWTYATQIGNRSITDYSSMDAWVQGARANPVNGILVRWNDRAKKEVKQGYTNEAIKAVQDEDFTALQASIEAIKEAGGSASSVKTALTKIYKPLYIQAYQDGDDDTLWEIRSILDWTELGYSDTDYSKWISAAEDRTDISSLEDEDY